jgi:hypothetical protein
MVALLGARPRSVFNGCPRRPAALLASIPRKYAATSKGYAEGSGEERGDKPTSFSVFSGVEYAFPGIAEAAHDRRAHRRPPVHHQADPLDDVVDEGFSALMEHKNEHAKIFAQPTTA